MHSKLTLLGLGKGGGGGGRSARADQFQLSRTSLMFKQYLPNVATLTKIYWRTRFWKNFVSGYNMLPWQPSFRRHVTQILAF